MKQKLSPNKKCEHKKNNENFTVNCELQRKYSINIC